MRGRCRALARTHVRVYIAGMKTLVLPLAICGLLALPVQAEEEGLPPPAQENAPLLFDLFERLLQGFMTEVEPQMRELERGFTALEPELQRFLQQLRDMTQYHPPEILPNGDILIRRREGVELPPENDFDQDSGDAEDSSEEPFEL